SALSTFCRASRTLASASTTRTRPFIISSPLRMGRGPQGLARQGSNPISGDVSGARLKGGRRQRGDDSVVDRSRDLEFPPEARDRAAPDIELARASILEVEQEARLQMGCQCLDSLEAPLLDAAGKVD